MRDDLNLDSIRAQIEAAQARGVPDPVIRATMMRTIVASQRRLVAIRALLDMMCPDGLWDSDPMGEA